MTVKTETTRAANATTMGRVRSAKSKVASAIPHEEPTRAAMTEEQMLEHLKQLAPKHPWIGTIMRLGTMAIGFSATYAFSISVLATMLVGSTSMMWMGLCLFVYFLFAFIGYMLSWKAADKTGEYFEANGFDNIVSTVRGWFTRTPSTQGA